MKKIFTLLTMALLAIGAQAQTITWTADDECSKGSAKTSYSNGPFVLNCTDTDKSKHQIDANDAYFGTADEQVKFDHRFRTNGKSSSSNALSLTIPSSGTLKVYVRTGSNSDATRNLVLTQSGSELYNAIVKEADAILVKGLDETNPDNDTKVYPVISVSVVAGTVDITYPVNGLNFYGFEFVSGGGEEPQAVDVAFSLTKSEIFLDETSQIIITGKSGLDGLTMNDLDYDGDVIDIDNNGVITPLSVGTTDITFTTDAVEGKYNPGEASLTIEVKERPIPDEIDYPTSTDGVLALGTTAFATVKIHANTDEVSCVKLNNGYTTDGVMNGNHIKLMITDGFKAGDKITIAGVINNKDNAKRGTVVLFAEGEENKATKINTFDDFINSYTATEDPEEQTYTLTAPYDVLYIGRDGTSAACLTLIKVEHAAPAEAHEPTTWDFTKELSEADAANLEADDNWAYDEENVRYTYVPSFTSEEAKSNSIVLSANGTELDIIKGLFFGRDGSIDANKFGIDLGKGLNFGGGKYRVILTGLAKDDKVRVRIAGTGDGNRSVTLSNVIEEDGLTSTDKAVAEGEFTVAADGSVIIETTAALLINAIAINAELPEYTPTGISVINAETVSNGAIYNLSGQRVDENYRGVVIKNGKKQIQK